MKIEMSVLERGYVANRLRKAAMAARTRAAKSDRTRAAELEEEAQVAEELAIRYDEGGSVQATESEPIIADSRKDLDYLDNTGGGARQ